MFTGIIGDPAGGWNDFKSSTDSIEEAEDMMNTKQMYEWVQVVDTEAGAVIMALDAPYEAEANQGEE